MGKVAYRFLPCDQDGHPRETSRYTTIAEDGEELGLGSVIEAEILGYRTWEVVDVRETPGSLLAATDAVGTEMPLGGTLVCRGLE